MSVSGVNQIISIYVALLWLLLLKKSIGPVGIDLPIRWDFAVPVMVTFITCIGFVSVGRTFKGAHGHQANRRESIIIED